MWAACSKVKTSGVANVAWFRKEICKAGEVPGQAVPWQSYRAWHCAPRSSTPVSASLWMVNDMLYRCYKSTQGKETDHACAQSKTNPQSLQWCIRLLKHLPSLVLPDATHSQLHGEVLPCAAADATHQRLQETKRQQLEALASYWKGT